MAGCAGKRRRHHLRRIVVQISMAVIARDADRTIYCIDQVSGLTLFDQKQCPYELGIQLGFLAVMKTWIFFCCRFCSLYLSPR